MRGLRASTGAKIRIGRPDRDRFGTEGTKSTARGHSSDRCSGKSKERMVDHNPSFLLAFVSVGFV